MNDDSIILERFNTIRSEYEGILVRGISEYAFQEKGLPPIQPFSVFIKNQKLDILGGVSGVTFYGSLYVDSLWIHKTMRRQGWGTKLICEAEQIAIERGVKFMTLHTMDWEGLPFYQKLGYSIEFVRDGYHKNSKMFLLRKNLLGSEPK